MKKMKIFVAMVLVFTMVVSLCACSALTDMVKSTTYNTGDLKDGFKVQSSAIPCVSFVVPEKLYNEAYDDDQYYEDGMKAMEDEEYADTFLGNTYEIVTSEYTLLNYSKIMLMVGGIDLEKRLDTVESAGDVEDVIGLENAIIDFEFGNSYIKSNLDGVTKVICPMSTEMESPVNEAVFKYSGYVAIIENSDGDAYMMIVASTEKNDDEMEYIAKSLAFNGKSLEGDEGDSENRPTAPTDPDTTPDDETNEDQPTPSKPAENNSAQNELKKFQFKADGQTISMPMKLSDFMEKFDLVIWEDEENSTVDPDDFEYLYLEKSDNSDECFMVGVANTTDKALAFEDCMMFSIDVDYDDLYDYGDASEPFMEFVFPCNVVIGETTEAELLALYGTPDSADTSMDGNRVYYYWDLSTKSYDSFSEIEVTYDKEEGFVTCVSYTVLP